LACSCFFITLLFNGSYRMIYSRTIWSSHLRGGKTRFYSEDQTEQKYAILADY